MSISYSASVFYGYSLPESELDHSQPNPLWGKHKYDPDTGDKVDQFIEGRVELALEDGDYLPGMKDFTRRDVGESILLGIELSNTGDLNYSDCEPQALKLLSEAKRAKVEEAVIKLLSKAGVTFDPGLMGYWLTGMVS